MFRNERPAGLFMILLGFLSVTGDNYNLFWDILVTVYAYSADWVVHCSH